MKKIISIQVKLKPITKLFYIKMSSYTNYEITTLSSDVQFYYNIPLFTLALGICGLILLFRKFSQEIRDIKEKRGVLLQKIKKLEENQKMFEMFLSNYTKNVEEHEEKHLSELYRIKKLENTIEYLVKKENKRVKQEKYEREGEKFLRTWNCPGWGSITFSNNMTGIFTENGSVIGNFYWKYNYNEKIMLLKIRWRNSHNYICKLQFNGADLSGVYASATEHKVFNNYNDLNQDPNTLNINETPSKISIHL
jgi:hypothetical protein